VKLVFIDAEYTGEHAYTTLVALGLVTLEGESLYVTLNDYARDQVTEWLRDNVLALIDEEQSVSSKHAHERISSWLERYSGGDPVSLVSAGLGSDLLLLFELYHHACPDLPYFHALHCLPEYLNHVGHLDLNTLFVTAGIDPNVDRDAFVGSATPERRHEALHDALVVRECFIKLLRDGLLPRPLADALA
jgi:DNA polymerase III epsilon subunit-like protein